MVNESILIVDDEETIRWVLCTLMGDLGCEAVPAASGEEALARLTERPIAVALIDIVLPGMSGIDLLARIKQTAPETEVLVMTSHASAETSIEALRRGAYDYFHKPFEIDEVAATVSRALEKRRLSDSNRRLLQEQAAKNEELSAAVKRISSLYKASIGTNGLQSVDDLLGFLIDVVTTELGVDRASIMLATVEGDALAIAASRGVAPEIVEAARVPMGEGIAGRVAQTGTAILVKDVRLEPGLVEPPKPHLGDSFVSAPIVLSVPIQGTSQVLGVINVTNRADDRKFNEEDLAYLSGLSALAAIAIERARRSDELKAAVRNLRDTQEELVNSARIAALGKMAAGVAHDFNNTLNGILGRAEMLLAALTDNRLDPAQFGRNLERIVALARQGAETVRRIQDFSRIRKDRPDERMDLNDVVNRTVDLTRLKWKNEALAQGRHIRLETNLQPLPLVQANLNELCQTLSNLIFNSVEAMPQGGSLTLHTWAEGNQVCVAVEDTGIGMSQETRDQLFEPFYSTKESGTGLGLSVVYGIVTRLGGTIQVESQENQGSRITIRLPAQEAATPPAPSSTPLQELPRAGLRVLVIDDGEQNRELYCEVLEAEGMQVESASNGEQGLSLFRGGSYDVVITDLSMPGISGWKVAHGIKELSPTTPVLLLSGWAVQQHTDSSVRPSADLVLAKPVSIDDLVRSVAELHARKSRETGVTAPRAA